MDEKKLRVLVAEDATGEASDTLRELYPEREGRLDVTDVGSLSTLLPTIVMVHPDVALVDLSLVRPESVEGIRRVRRAAPQVPLVVIADKTEKQEAIQCLDAGAVDYLLKGFMDVPTVDRALRTAIERNTLSALADLLRDPVTDLYTREGFLTLGVRALETAPRKNGTLVLLCVLLENGVAIRQEMGSVALEQTVRDLAGILTSSFRRTDVVARLGENLFAALAVDAAEPSAPVLLQRVKRRVETQNSLRDEVSGMHLRMAVGFWSPKEEVTFHELLDRVESELRANPAAKTGEVPRPVSVVSR